MPFLILGNKIDVPMASSEDEMRGALGLHNMTTGKVRLHHAQREAPVCTGVVRLQLHRGCMLAGQVTTNAAALQGKVAVQGGVRPIEVFSP